MSKPFSDFYTYFVLFLTIISILKSPNITATLHGHHLLRIYIIVCTFISIITNFWVGSIDINHKILV